MNCYRTNKKSTNSTILPNTKGVLYGGIKKHMKKEIELENNVITIMESSHQIISQKLIKPGLLLKDKSL